MVSLVVPIFNEEELIDELVPRTTKALENFTKDFELIFVDDGSVDSSLEKLVSYQEQDERIIVISFSKNFGHQSAFTAGLEFAKGDYVAMMDGDLQDPPELLAEMHQKLTTEDFDIVSGKRTSRKGNITKNIFTNIFHSIFKKVADVDELENAGNFSMMNRNAVNALISLPNLHDLLVHAKLQKHRQDMQVPCWHFPLQFQSRCLTRPYIKHKTSHYL